MCGIAGFIGYKEIPRENIQKTLETMKHRGPDHQCVKELQTTHANNIHVTFLHARLSIIDLHDRSNQPFTINESTIIFNGEIYNYLEIRKELEDLGICFNTSSDTEVLLQCYRMFGVQGFEKLEGMWSFAIWDNHSQELILSRDRFGEKPLYIMKSDAGLYFASETKILYAISNAPRILNEEQLLRYIFLGYKSLYKKPETYFENIEEIPSGTYAIIQKNLDYKSYRYWNPTYHIKELSLEDAIEGSRHFLLESLKIRLRADVPLAFCLSGGVDSAAIASIAAKKFNCNVTTFSIIDSDERYNEYENIMATVNDLSCRHFNIELSHTHTLENLSALVQYHDAPIATASYYVHSLLSREIARQGFKVSFSGTAADEIFTGYYDHFILQLAELYKTDEYAKLRKDWETHILQHIRNSILKDPDLYIHFPNFREHIFDNHKEYISWIEPIYMNTLDSKYTETTYTNNILRNRMLNELFTEATPVILHEDDLNSMYYSIENRSPYLDSRLFEFVNTVPTRHLIKNGYGKYLLRESVAGILNEKVRLTRKKKGFNASIHSLFDFSSDEVRDRLCSANSKIFNFVKKEKVLPLLEAKTLPNHHSKFLFNIINAQLFMELL